MKLAVLYNLLIVLSLVGSEAAAAELPPLGKRKYFIDGADPAAPVSITSDQTKRPQVYLKDPMNSLKPTAIKPLISQRRIKAKAKIAERKRAVKESRLAFKPLAVNGRKTKPRVKFKREWIEVDRADEPLDKDFYQKVFLPAQDANF